MTSIPPTEPIISSCSVRACSTVLFLGVRLCVWLMSCHAMPRHVMMTASVIFIVRVVVSAVLFKKSW